MSQTTITLLFLAFAIISFILEKIPLGLTATIVALGLNLTGVLDVSQTFAGYINSNVILCVGMFVVGQALFETGMANKIGGVVTKFAKSERMLIIAIMIIVGVMSGFLSNTGTAAVLIPVVCGIADESGYSRSRLLMPLVFAAALGGNLSIIGRRATSWVSTHSRRWGSRQASSCTLRSVFRCWSQASSTWPLSATDSCRIPEGHSWTA